MSMIVLGALVVMIVWVLKKMQYVMFQQVANCVIHQFLVGDWMEFMIVTVALVVMVAQDVVQMDAFRAHHHRVL